MSRLPRLGVLLTLALGGSLTAAAGNCTMNATYAMTADSEPDVRDADFTIPVLAAGTTTNFVTKATAASWTCETGDASNLPASIARNEDGTATVTLSPAYGDGTARTVTVKGDGTTVFTITVSRIGPRERTVTLETGATFEDSCTFHSVKTWSCVVTPGTCATASLSTTGKSTSTTVTIVGGSTPGTETVTVRRGASNGSNVDMYVYHVTVAGGGDEPPVGPPSGGDAFSVTPYLQHPATDAMTIFYFTRQPSVSTAQCWRADGVGSSVTQTTVGVWAQALTNNLAVSEPADSSVWNNSLYRHRVRFEGLEAGTRYTYAVNVGDTAYTNSFRTVPDRNTPIRFVSYADCETIAEPWDNYVRNLRQMQVRNPDFVAISGDIVARGGIQSHWDGFWKANAGEKGDLAGSVPMLVSIGNHDLFDNGLPGDKVDKCWMYDLQGETGTERFLSYFEFNSNGVSYAVRDGTDIPETRDMSQLFHREDYGPVTLIFLDTNNGQDGDTDADHDCDSNYFNGNDGKHLPGGLDRRKGARHPDFNPGTPQYTWLTNNLADAQAKSRFTFVFNHHCPYSIGSHNQHWSTGEDGSSLAVRVLTETMVRYGVDGWFCGHDEILEHSITNGWEILPNGQRRKHTLSIYDLGCSGDELRRSDKVTNPLEYFKVTSGYYGFLETDVTTNRNGRWTCTITPVNVAGGSYAVHKDRIVIEENVERDETTDDLVYREHSRDAPPDDWLKLSEDVDDLPERNEDEPVREADVTVGELAMGTVLRYTLNGKSSAWNCKFNSEDGESQHCLLAEVQVASDGTATLVVSAPYAYGAQQTVSVYAGSATPGAGTLIKKVTVGKIVAVTQPLTLHVGETFTTNCAFALAKPWTLVTEGTAVSAALSTASGENATTTTLTLVAAAEGNSKITVKRLNKTGSATYETPMCVLDVRVLPGGTPFERLQAVAHEGGEYALAEDVEAPADGILTIPAGKTFTLDLNGHALHLHADGAIRNDGMLTIVDTADAGPFEAHISYTADEFDKAYTLIRSSGSLIVDTACVLGGYVEGEDAYGLESGNSVVRAEGGSVTVTADAWLCGLYGIVVAGDCAVGIADGGEISAYGYCGTGELAPGVCVRVVSGASQIAVSNAILSAEGCLVSVLPGSETAVRIVDSELKTCHAKTPFDLRGAGRVTLARSSYEDTTGRLSVTAALANEGADLSVGAGCRLTVRKASVIGFLAGGVTVTQEGPQTWLTVAAAEDADLPQLTTGEANRVVEILEKSPDELLKASVATVEEYKDFRAWVKGNVENGTIASASKALSAAGTYFSFATDQRALVDPAAITDDKVKVEKVEMTDGAAVRLTVRVQDLPIGAGARAEHLEKVFGVTGAASLEEDFSSENVTYRQDMTNNGDGSVTYSAEPKGAVKPTSFYFRTTIRK